MDLTHLLEECKLYKKKDALTLKLLTEISRLDQQREQNLPKLKKRLIKLDEAIKQFYQYKNLNEGVLSWINSYKQELTNSEEQIKNRFGIELEQEFKKIGLLVAGQYPELKAGLFTIELFFDKGLVTLWYGPKQERLAQCRLLSHEIASNVEKFRQQVGSHLDNEAFLKKLRDAYFRADDTKHGEPLPITDVLAEVAFLLQSQQFWSDPRQDNYKGYSRADFSYDLFLARQSLNKNLHLTVATRANTRRRQDFLWIPDDESGKGTAYSHLQFKENST
ncbi:conserved hypothetical protein [Candidatus Brocadia pituitae]|nr:conserved hypothetical protein [Candidatus Brocadia pituitae]